MNTADLELLISKYSEWLIYGVWDTPRCQVCGGFQYRGGHKDKCLRKQFEERETKGQMILFEENT